VPAGCYLAKNRDRPRIHRGDDCFHATVRVPAETNPAADTDGCAGSD